jgi:V8-like Glu-specific endopeptidase
MKFTLFLFLFLSVLDSYAGSIVPPKAIYGKDDRSFVTEKKLGPDITSISKSIALIVSKDNVEEKFFSTLIRGDLINDQSGVNLCFDQRFSGHHSVMSCTGFLIAENKLVSAGHCFMNNYDCETKKIIFHVLEKNETDEGYKVAHQNVFNCKRILKQEMDASGERDFAIIELDRKVRGASPLKLSKSKLQLNTSMFMIGHPLGLPQVISSAARAIDISNNNIFKATLDSFAGNSGSPVFNSSTLEVEGILVSGQDDFETTPNGCSKYKSYSEIFEGAGQNGEGVMRMSEIIPFIQ